MIATAIAGAGLTLALDHPQNDAGRPELTARGDAIVRPRLAALVPALADLSAAADGVAEAARRAYGLVRNRDTAAARAALPQGDAAVAALTAATTRVTDARAGLLTGTSRTAVSEAIRQWISAMDQAIVAAGKVPATWGLMANAAVLPIAVAETLTQHDATVADAASRARTADYQGAVLKLSEARTILDRARGLATQAAQGGLDTSTLRGWISRSAQYDEALIGLYAILIQSGGSMTAEARTALASVMRAQRALPKDTTALTIMVADAGGQKMTQGLIDLDQLRGQISIAVNQPGASGPTPGG